MPEQNQQELEKLARDFQILQEQLRNMGMQIEQLKLQKADLDRAMEELDKATGKVYYSVGGIIVETDKEKAKTDVKDRSELTDTRIKSATKQMDDLKAREKQLSEKITQLYKQDQGQSEGVA